MAEIYGQNNFFWPSDHHIPGCFFFFHHCFAGAERKEGRRFLEGSSSIIRLAMKGASNSPDIFVLGTSCRHFQGARLGILLFGKIQTPLYAQKEIILGI